MVYRQRKRKTFELLRDNGQTLSESGAHRPQWFEKSKMLAIGKTYDLDNPENRLLVELLYFNTYEQNPERLDFSSDGWFYRFAAKTPPPDFDARLAVAKFFNHKDKVFRLIEDRLTRKFLRQSPLEPFAIDKFLKTIVGDSEVSEKTRAPKVILDIGSRNAVQACEFSTVFPAADVYAFECHPTGIRRIKARLKSAPRVNLVEKAVSNHNGQATFYKAPSLGCSSLLELTPEYKDVRRWTNKPPAETLQVDTIRIDTWAESAGIDKIDIAWIDVQGAELSVLEGFGDLLQSVSAIWLEVAWKDITAYQNQPSQAEVVEFMESAGFVELDRFANAGQWDGNIVYVNSRFDPAAKSESKNRQAVMV
jgi:FkbM family methyltransferase